MTFGLPLWEASAWIYYFNQTIQYWGRNNFSKGNQHVREDWILCSQKLTNIVQAHQGTSLWQKNQGKKWGVEV